MAMDSEDTASPPVFSVLGILLIRTLSNDGMLTESLGRVRGESVMLSNRRRGLFWLLLVVLQKWLNLCVHASFCGLLHRMTKGETYDIYYIGYH